MGSLSTGAIVFTDMVDSTALRSRLGDDRADQLREHHDDLLRSTAEAHHGHVLRWTGDGVKAGFPTSTDAVSAAVAMQRAVLDYCASERCIAPFQIRIGLSVGELIIDDGGDHRGVAVIEAARLEALARPGEILVTDMVRLLSSRRSNVTFEEIGERVLKGLDLPVLVHRVVDLERGSAPSIPRMLAVDSRTPLVGREGPIEEFHRQWDQARVGSLGLMVVRGQAGIGKTRFVSHCAEIAHRSGAIVLAGTCSSDVSVPYEPFAVAFGAIRGLDPTLGGALNGQGPLARLFPSENVVPAEGQLSHARLELFDAVAALIGRLSAGHPLLLVLDDMHWAALPTVMLLQHLVEHGTDWRMQIIATFREGDLDPTHPMRTVVSGSRRSVRTATVDLASLSETDVARMVSAAAPAAPITRVAEIAELVCGESAGNPFFVSELINHLATTGHLDARANRASVSTITVPDTVHNVVLERLSQLPDGARDVLVSAAVIGATFDVDLLVDVVERRTDDVLDILDEVVRRGLLTEVGINRFAFVHAIVRNALLDVLSASRRARAHRRVAEALEARGAEQFDELARHWQLGGEEQRSTRYLMRAARRDYAALALESAKARYREVIEHQDRDPNVEVVDRAEAWVGLVGALRALGDPTFTEAVTRASRLARSARSARLMAESAALSSWLGVSFFTSEIEEVEFIELCEDALTLLDNDDPARVRVLATLASHLTFSPDNGPRLKLIEEATELANRHGDPLLTAAVLHAELICTWEPATLDRREGIARSLGRLARASGDVAFDFLSRYVAIYCKVERGDVDVARDDLVALRATIDPARNEYHLFLVDRLTLAIDILRCVPDVQQQVDRFLETFSRQVDTQTSWMLQTGLISFHAGTFGQMLNAAQAMTAGAQSHLWTSAYALALMFNGDHTAAEELLNQFGDPARHFFWMIFTQARAEVAAGLRSPDHCRHMFEMLLPFRGRIGVSGSGSGCFGLVSRSLGQLALALDDHVAAEELLTEAIAHAERVGAVFDAVSSRRMLAESRQARGLHDEIAQTLGEALVLAEKHGFGHEAKLIRALTE